MKKLLAIVLVVAIAAMGTGVALAGNNNNGNGAPSGAHYNLNIIGMKHEKTDMGDKVGGHVIFVELHSTKSGRMGIETDILLAPAPSCPTTGPWPCETFYVRDGNGTDGEATFQLPADVATTYTVWVRALGKPGGEADMWLCAWDPVLEDWICNTNEVHLYRGKGKPMHLGGTDKQQKFVDVTSELLYIDGVPLFDAMYEDYFWKYVGNGLKLAQLRFYPVTD